MNDVFKYRTIYYIINTTGIKENYLWPFVL